VAALDTEESGMASQSEERIHRLLADSALDLILVLDGEGKVEYVSPSLQRILGYQPEEAIGKDAFFFADRGDITRVSEYFSQWANMPGVSHKIDFWASHKDGSVRFLEAIGTRIPDGQPGCDYLISVRDITDRRQAQEILGDISAVFLSLGADPLKNMRFLVKAGGEILGTDLSLYCRLHRGRMSVFSTAQEEESELSDEGRGSMCHDIITGIAEGPLIIGDLDEAEYRYSDFYAAVYGFKSCTALPVILDGSVVGCLCAYYFEIKEFNPNEIAVMELGAKAISVEEERAAHEDGLKDLMDIVSHELRHPITILKGYTGFMRESWRSLEGEKKDEILGIIESSADRLETLVNDFLDVSRMEKGMFNIHKRAVDLNLVITKAIEEMREKGIENDFVISLPEEGGTVEGDPERLIQLLIILLENAVKYSAESSTIELEAVRKNGQMEVSVLDLGLGIREEDRERVFERFYQSEEARNHNSKSGIGLGLYIARKIVEAHGGRIWYEPRTGNGSAFRFILP
jgi:PAS domain S-box-containing protein